MITNTHTIRRLKKGVRHPHFVAQHFNSMYYRRRYNGYDSSGIDCIQQDWDNLIILDACRFDAFKQANTIDGRISKKRLKASTTVGFIETQFCNRDLTDTIYVTANPQINWESLEDSVRFHDIIHVWKGDGWDEDLQSVPPGTMVDSAVQALSNYPEKRLIIHFLQPHCPFIGQFGQNKLPDSNLDFWPRVVKGEVEVSDADLLKAYHENLEIVLRAVTELVESLRGKTIVTADHGQIIGTRTSPIPIREYGHPRTTYIDELVTVPWLELPTTTRRSIVAEKPVPEASQTRASCVEERLSQLGYQI